MLDFACIQNYALLVLDVDVSLSAMYVSILDCYVVQPLYYERKSHQNHEQIVCEVETNLSSSRMKK